MKDLTVDELLTQMFRDTANRVGWNVYRKSKRCIIVLKRGKDEATRNLKKLHLTGDANDRNNDFDTNQRADTFTRRPGNLEG